MMAMMPPKMQGMDADMMAAMPPEMMSMGPEMMAMMPRLQGMEGHDGGNAT